MSPEILSLLAAKHDTASRASTHPKRCPQGQAPMDAVLQPGQSKAVCSPILAVDTPLQPNRLGPSMRGPAKPTRDPRTELYSSSAPCPAQCWGSVGLCLAGYLPNLPSKWQSAGHVSRVAHIRPSAGATWPAWPMCAQRLRELHDLRQVGPTAP